jgi:hypothetical protein
MRLHMVSDCWFVINIGSWNCARLSKKWGGRCSGVNTQLEYLKFNAKLTNPVNRIPGSISIARTALSLKKKYKSMKRRKDPRVVVLLLYRRFNPK